MRFPEPLIILLLAIVVIALGEPALAQRRDADLLTFARGAAFVSQTGLSSGSAGIALLAIDGDPYRLGLGSDADSPIEFTYKLPARTTFSRFAIPNVIEQPGNVTFVKSVTVSGSDEGPDSGYRQLGEFLLEIHGRDREVTEMTPDALVPVRWIRVRFEDGINIEPGDEGRTVLWFSELIANGVQEPRTLSSAFTGEWALRLTERLDLRGLPMSLEQTGSTVHGCYDDVPLSGSVNGAIARVSGEASDGRRAALILIAGDDGTIQASASINGGRFRAFTAIEEPDPASIACMDERPAPRICGTNAYINFDFDSADIRPESLPILADVYSGLLEEDARQVSIIGHTSTEGSADYNQLLSADRAQAVVDNLVSRGFDAAGISAVGLGEMQPLFSPDASETARELNRRVTISCE